MFGIRFIKFQPTTHVIQYRGGRVVREGRGLSFFFYAPSTSLVAVPIGSTDAPFIFTDITADFQEITLQGQVTYRVSNPTLLAELLNFTFDPARGTYVSDDPTKVTQRVINIVQVLVHRNVSGLDLRGALRESDVVVRSVRESLASSPEIGALGLEILALSIMSVRPTPETARALEAEAREQILLESDEAIYRRRNAAVEQERAIRENELNTEIAVENKKRQIREAQMDAERAVQEKQDQLEQAKMRSRIDLEEQRKDLVERASANARMQAEAKAHGMSVMMGAFGSVDPKVLQALANIGMKPDQLIATAFQGLADRAEKIGELNISPDLLRGLMESKK
jgi:regulator of protease activity HflC (stomatin/prohibitin superfamily)